MSGSLDSIDSKLECSWTSDEGAVLLCDNTVCERFAFDTTSFKEWGKKHAKQLFIEEPQTRQFGFFIVTAVSRTKGCLLKCWSKKKRTIAANPVVSSRTSIQLLQHEVNVEAGIGHTDSAWIKCPSDQERVFSKSFLI